MFEVGKKYKQKGTDHLFVPQYVGKTHAFGVFTHYALSKTFKQFCTETSFPHSYTKLDGYYEEYKKQEPRSIEPRWFNIFVNMSEPDKIWLSGTPYRTKESAVEYAKSYMHGTTLVDTIKIEYTEQSAKLMTLNSVEE